MRPRIRHVVLATALAWLLTASLAAGAARSPVVVDASVGAGGIAAIRLHAACTVRARVRLATRFRVLRLTRAVTVQRGSTRTVSVRLSGAAGPVNAQVMARVLGSGCRSTRGTVAWRTVPVVDAGATAASAALPSWPTPTPSPPTPAPTSGLRAPSPSPPSTPASPPMVDVAAKLSWAPPQLTDPTVVTVTNANRALVLDPRRDYIVRMPRQPLTASGGLAIAGGHNVVLIGGEIYIPWQGTAPPEDSRRALYLKEQTGTVHVEGLLMSGPDLTEGIDIDERQGAVVQIENIRIENIHARDELHYADNHPDLIQSWGGPAELRVDRLTGSTDYQGFFLHPQQFDAQAAMRLADLRNVQIVGNAKAGYLLWQADPFAKNLLNVWVAPNPTRPWEALWPGPGSWSGVNYGAPAGGDYVPAGSVGANYVSPGYTQ